MITNYIKIVIRNILRHKVYSIINIIGLAVGYQTIKAARGNPVDAWIGKSKSK